MLQFKTFKVTEDEAICDFLKTHRLVAGAHIFQSEGYLAFPYEDCMPPSKEQLIAAEFELLEGFEKQRDLMIHSQKVLDLQVKGVEKEIERTKASITDTPQGKEEVKANKLAEKEVNRLEGVKVQTENQILMNQAELTRIMTNIAVHEETIATLKGEEVRHE